MTALHTDQDLRAALSHDMVYQGKPDYALRARDKADVAAALKECHEKGIPVTVCGSQTSMTGASAADSGLALSITNLNKIIEIGADAKTGEGFAIVEPGVVLGDLKDAARAAGYFYPPDPTSYREALVGSTVATNATGEDTFKYGPTRRYIQEMDILTAAGMPITLKRSTPAPALPVKNSAGYFWEGEDIDALIGSEGTLGVITRLRLRLLPGRDRDFVILVLPFKDFAASLAAVVHLDKTASPARAIELIGPGAGAYFSACAACPTELRGESCFLTIKVEYTDVAGSAPILDDWMARIESMYAAVGEPNQLSKVFAALTDTQKEAIRQCRHAIPLKVNEEYFPFVESGGGKVGTDWWVPLHHLEEMMLSVYTEAQELGIPFLVFAHIGNGHPHWNFLTRTATEKARAKEFVNAQCRRAVLYDGGVAGEHGIGKIKRDLLAIQHAPKVIQKMIALKLKWDPQWILGRGNILKPPDTID